MDDSLQQAIKFIKSGDKKRGGQLLAEIVKKDPHNLNAWLWLSSCVNSDKQRIYCLQKALEIDPNHQVARSALSKLQHREHPSEAEILGKNEPHPESLGKLQNKQNPIKAQTTTNIPVFIKNLTTGKNFLLLTGLISIVSLVCVILVIAASTTNNFNQPQQPTVIPLPTQTTIPRVHSSDLDSICIKNGELPMGYAVTETINNINDTEHEDKYKVGIDGYYSIKWEAPSYPAIRCQLFLYSESSIASSIFRDIANVIGNGPLREQFSLSEYGDERIGVVLLLNSPFYVYAYRKGRVIVEIDFISDQILEYSSINGIVKIVDTKLTQLNTR